MDESKELLVSILERYRVTCKISGKEAFDLFERYDAINLILENWEYFAHRGYSAIQEIHEYIEEKKAQEQSAKHKETDTQS